ncbi:MAG: TIGR02147 family protein [Pseudomonadota bacterium]
MKTVFHYTDYRAFLRDFYEEHKNQTPSYSFRFFARKAGLQSPNYFKLVMDGDRNLTHRNVRKFVKGLGLNDREGLYFENLVYFNQAKDGEERAFFKKNLDLARSNGDMALLTKDQYEVLAHWFPLAVKELIQLDAFQNKPKWIASRLDYKITPEEAKEAVALLIRLKLVEQNEKDGLLKVTEQSLQTPDVTRSEAVKQYHAQMMGLAQKAMEAQSHEERCFSAVTVAIRKKDLPEAFRRIHRFRNEMNSFFTQGKPYDAVYQLNIQLFRLDDDV